MLRKRKQLSALDPETKEQINMKRKKAHFRESSSERYVSTHLTLVYDYKTFRAQRVSQQNDSDGVLLTLHVCSIRCYFNIYIYIVQLEQLQDITPRMLLKAPISNLRHVVQSVTRDVSSD